jgi:hypothetical protein
MSGGENVPWTIPGTLIEKIMASPPQADPQKEAQRQKFLQQLHDTGSIPSRLYQYLSRRLPAATGCVNPLFCPGRSITSPEPAWRTRTHATHMTVT